MKQRTAARVPRLVLCVRHLGFRLGWRYWRLDRMARQDPMLMQYWAERCRRESMSVTDQEFATTLRQWANELDRSRERWEYKTRGGADARQGWRFFHCEDCEHRWKEASRDWRSPSGANCPRCGEWWFPYHGEADASLSVDNMGNLVPPNAKVRDGETGPRTNTKTMNTPKTDKTAADARHSTPAPGSEKYRASLAIVDELACKSCNPDLFEKWCELVRYWDEYFPQFKGVAKDYHRDDPPNVEADVRGQTKGEK